MAAKTGADLDRAYWFDAQIRKNRYPNASSLAEQFEISLKAAQATIDRMRDSLHFPLDYVAERRGYRYLDDAFQVPPLWLQEPTATSLLLAYDLLTRLLEGASDSPQHPEAARVFQVAGVSRTLRERMTFETVEHHPPRAEIFTQVLQALAQDRVLELDYASKGEAGRSIRRVEPRQLHNFAGNWYLFAHCRRRDDLRMFSLDRMRRASVLDEGFDYPPDYDPQALAKRAFGHFKTGRVQQARLRFSPFISAWVKDQTWHHAQVATVLEDGSLELQLPYAGDGLDLVREVMKFGPEVEVIAPEELRQSVMSRLRNALDRYAPEVDLPPHPG